MSAFSNNLDWTLFSTFDVWYKNWMDINKRSPSAEVVKMAEEYFFDKEDIARDDAIYRADRAMKDFSCHD